MPRSNGIIMKTGSGKKESSLKDYRQYALAVLLVLAAAFVFAACGNEKHGTGEPISLTGRTMGTSFTVKAMMKTPQSEEAKQKLDDKINALLREVNRQMSTYIKDSELSQFNRHRETDWFAISADFAYVAQKALDISDLTNGSLDMTVGPLVNLWGFGPDGRPNKIPDAETVATLQKNIGYKNIAVRQEPPAIRKEIPEIYCDLSAIAKGFGVDKVADYLESLDVENYMVEIGGEVRTRGRNPQGQDWHIGIESPDNPEGIQKILSIGRGAMATSGDYFNYFEIEGVRYSHTIDPRTGRPITHKLASVTVIDSLCTQADGLATAIDVMGPDAGLQFATERELAVFMVVRVANGFEERMTPGFKSFLEAKN